jgi:Putative bacterial sensory transduction regulator
MTGLDQPKGIVINSDMVKAYVESLLENLTGTEKVKPDHDGDYPIRYRSAQYYVRVLDGREPVVQIFAVAVADVKATDSLMRDLNDINAQLQFCRAFWVQDQILFEAEHLGLGLTQNDFHERIVAVAGAADHFGGKLAARYDGRTAFADEQDEDYTPPDDPPAPGYL